MSPGLSFPRLQRFEYWPRLLLAHGSTDTAAKEREGRNKNKESPRRSERSPFMVYWLVIFGIVRLLKLKPKSPRTTERMKKAKNATIRPMIAETIV